MIVVEEGCAFVGIQGYFKQPTCLSISQCHCSCCRIILQQIAGWRGGGGDQSERSLTGTRTQWLPSPCSSHTVPSSEQSKRMWTFFHCHRDYTFLHLQQSRVLQLLKHGELKRKWQWCIFFKQCRRVQVITVVMLVWFCMQYLLSPWISK